jgi:hypothetical protein
MHPGKSTVEVQFKFAFAIRTPATAYKHAGLRQARAAAAALGAKRNKIRAITPLVNKLDWCSKLFDRSIQSARA